jgi:HEPN domain-containing protein
MSAPDEEVRRKVTQWLVYGDEDLRLARHGLTLPADQPFRLIAYHAQQCAEKYLKGYLVFHQIDFPYTHNISRLVEMCSEQGLEGETLQDAEELSPFAITARYPGEGEEVTEEEALRAIDIAARVREVVKESLMQKYERLQLEP